MIVCCLSGGIDSGGLLPNEQEIPFLCHMTLLRDNKSNKTSSPGLGFQREPNPFPFLCGTMDEDLCTTLSENRCQEEVSTRSLREVVACGSGTC